MKNLLMAASALALAGCGTVGKLSVLDRDETPRTAAVLVAEDVTPALDDLATLCEVGVLERDTIALIARHGPVLVDVATKYFETAEACVVIEGALETDPTAGATCTRGSVKAVSRLLPNELSRLAGEFGLNSDVGKGLFVASVVARRVNGNNDGGAIDGFAKDDDLNRDEYIDALSDLRDARDRVSACVASFSTLPPSAGLSLN